jgi:hypothetical protein
MAPNRWLAELRIERGIASREALLCVAIRRRLLVILGFLDSPEECLFEPTVLYRSCDDDLRLSGVPIADAAKPFLTLLVSKIVQVSPTAKTFVVNPVVDRFDPTYAKGIVCLAAPIMSNKLRD